MDKTINDPKEWLKRSKSNLAMATMFEVEKIPEDIYLEDLCFELQQAAEKSIKALLVKYGIDFPKTHNITELLLIVQNKTTIEISDKIALAATLTPYAVKTRYPIWHKITTEQYTEAINIAQNTFNWAKEIIESEK